MKNLCNAFLVAAVLGVCVIGCTPEGREDMEQGMGKVGQGIKKDAEGTGRYLSKEGQKARQALKITGSEARGKIEPDKMTSKIKNAYASTADLKEEKIEVSTANGTVTLRGTVPTAKEKSEAEKIADGIAGKQYTVKDELAVVPSK